MDASSNIKGVILVCITWRTLNIDFGNGGSEMITLEICVITNAELLHMITLESSVTPVYVFLISSSVAFWSSACSSRKVPTLFPLSLPNVRPRVHIMTSQRWHEYQFNWSVRTFTRSAAICLALILHPSIPPLIGARPQSIITSAFIAEAFNPASRCTIMAARPSLQNCGGNGGNGDMSGLHW